MMASKATLFISVRDDSFAAVEDQAVDHFNSASTQRRPQARQMRFR